MANPIVTVIVSQQQAPTPNTLQKTGAMISQGGTILPAGSSTLIQQISDLNAILTAPVASPSPAALTGLSWASNVVTAVTGAAHGITAGTRFQTTIKGVTPAAYNGTFWAFAASATTFTYDLPLSTTPGNSTVSGTYTTLAAGELNAMVTTFFAQGFQQGCYVLELGAGTVAQGVQALRDYINANDQFFYSYLVPRSWDADTAFLDLIDDYETTTSKTYFYVTTNLTNYTTYLNGPNSTSTHKSVIALVEAPKYGSWLRTAVNSYAYATGKVTYTLAAAPVLPYVIKPGDWVTLTGFLPTTHNGTFMAREGTTGTALVVGRTSDPGAITSTPGAAVLAASVYNSAGVTPTEFTMAAAWWVSLNYSPGATSRVPPYSYSFLQGVTRFPTQGNQTVMTILKNANINLVGFGAEGGISDTILMYGHTLDGRPLNYWYSVDWMQINIDLNIANAIINGSNTTVNPLYYNQDGINRLTTVAARTGASGISFGLALGRVVQVGLKQQDFLVNLNNGLYAGALVVNGDPFTNYLIANPTHYAQGLYGGLTMAYTPLRGFEHIIFNIVVTDFVASA